MGKTPFIAAAVCLALLSPAARPAPGADTPGQIAEATRFVQEQCYRLIHHDTFAFEACVQGLLRDEKKPGPRRLGIEYFGWVGAMNSARLGMLGAEDSAYAFLPRFRATQKKLRIDDASLCRTIPGDCEVRIARMQQMEAAPRPRGKAAPRDGDEHGHHH